MTLEFALGAGLGHMREISLKRLIHHEIKTHKIITKFSFFDIWGRRPDIQELQISYSTPPSTATQPLPHKVALKKGFVKQGRHIAPNKISKTHETPHSSTCQEDDQEYKIQKLPIDPHATITQLNSSFPK